MLLRRALTIVAFLAIIACSAERDPAPTFHPEENPQTLSDWGMVYARDGKLRISENVTPYDLATPLFSDYALKLRTVWTAGDEPIAYSPDGAFDAPVGAVLTKTFYYPIDGEEWNGAVLQNEVPLLGRKTLPLANYRLIETRILVRRETGWEALAYVWNDAQTGALLKRTGDLIPLTLVRTDGRREDFAYLVPNQNQCAACHATNATTKEIQPIGLKARHLNKQSAYSPAFNQLDHWLGLGLLAIDDPQEIATTVNAGWTDKTESLDARARAYLDANCSHCHNPDGPADTSGLNLEPEAAGPALGLCKLPIAAGGGTGGRSFDIVPGKPDQSITLFRMETNDPAAMMPELGRAVAHEEGIALISEWIAEMEGGCR